MRHKLGLCLGIARGKDQIDLIGKTQKNVLVAYLGGQLNSPVGFGKNRSSPSSKEAEKVGR